MFYASYLCIQCAQSSDVVYLVLYTLQRHLLSNYSRHTGTENVIYLLNICYGTNAHESSCMFINDLKKLIKKKSNKTFSSITDLQMLIQYTVYKYTC